MVTTGSAYALMPSKLVSKSQPSAPGMQTKIRDRLHKEKHISLRTLTTRAQDRMCGSKREK